MVVIWGLEGRHLWVPPTLASVMTPAQAVAGGFGSLLTNYAVGTINPDLFVKLNADADGFTDLTLVPTAYALTANGAIAIGTGPRLGGDTGTSTIFDGTNDSVTTGFNAFTAAQFAAAGIAQRDSENHQDVLFAGNGATPPMLYIGTGGSDVIFNVRSTGGTGPFVWTKAWEDPLVPVRWAFNFNDTANTAELWINGVSQGVKTVADTWNTPGALVIGSGPPGFFDGDMSHFLATDNALLTADQIAHLNAYGAVDSRPVTLNRVVDDAGAKVYPRYNVEKITGLSSGGESADRRDNRIGAQGEIPRRSFRRGKTITYEGLVQALTRASLRQVEADMVLAFDDQVNEGLMVVTPHPLYDASGAYRYYNARALTCDIDDAAAFSPHRVTQGHQTPFVVALRNARAGGISYRDQTGAGYP